MNQVPRHSIYRLYKEAFVKDVQAHIPSDFKLKTDLPGSGYLSIGDEDRHYWLSIELFGFGDIYYSESPSKMAWKYVNNGNSPIYKMASGLTFSVRYPSDMGRNPDKEFLSLLTTTSMDIYYLKKFPLLL